MPNERGDLKRSAIVDVLSAEDKCKDDTDVLITKLVLLGVTISEDKIYSCFRPSTDNSAWSTPRRAAIAGCLVMGILKP